MDNAESDVIAESLVISESDSIAESLVIADSPMTVYINGIAQSPVIAAVGVIDDCFYTETDEIWLWLDADYNKIIDEYET